MLVQYNGPTEFVHLHLHSIFSTLDGVQTCEEVFDTCKERGWPAAAVTEHGHLASVPTAHFSAKDAGVKYIVGCEVYYNDNELERQRRALDPEFKLRALKKDDPVEYDKLVRNRHLTVLAKNAKGVENLIELTTRAYVDGFYYKPRIWFDRLCEYKDGLIILSGCLNGPVSHELRKGNMLEADRLVDKFKYYFGDNYYIELQMPCLGLLDNDNKSDYVVFNALNILAKKHNINKVLTNDAHYLTRDGYETQKIMMAIEQGLCVDDPNLFHVNSSEQFLKTRAELYETFKTNEYSKQVTDNEFEDMCNGTLEVADRCEIYAPDVSAKVPICEGADDKLRELVYAALNERGLDRTAMFTIDNKKVTYEQQIEIELNRLIEKEFANYFLITKDIVDYSLSQGWPVGPRGSVGGSLVCYLLGIHCINPAVWGLSFDRFLSSARGGKILNIKAE